LPWQFGLQEAGIAIQGYGEFLSRHIDCGYGDPSRFMRPHAYANSRAHCYSDGDGDIHSNAHATAHINANTGPVLVPVA